jgi:predicted transcriptional regulator
MKLKMIDRKSPRSISLPASTWKKLDKIARKNRIPRSVVVQTAMYSYIKAWEDDEDGK